MTEQTQSFSSSSPLDGLKNDTDLQLFDVHVHYHSKHFAKEFQEAFKTYNISNVMAITGPKVKKFLEDNQLIENVTFCYFLSALAFTRYKTKDLVEQVHEAKELGFKAIKIFFGPRLWQVSRRNEYYKIQDERLHDIYTAIEEEGFPVIIHVADPDIWYEKKYTNTQKYGTKNDRLTDFEELLKMFPNINWISAHFGCLPENLPKLSSTLDSYPNMFIDTGSTKWMIRELGKNIEETREFVKKYQERILWGSDIANRANFSMLYSRKNREKYWYSRFWSQRMFWETPYEADLAFTDSDNPTGTRIHGLNLPKEILQKIYFHNAQKVLNA